jgi:hypothetical protein
MQVSTGVGPGVFLASAEADTARPLRAAQREPRTGIVLALNAERNSVVHCYQPVQRVQRARVQPQPLEQVRPATRDQFIHCRLFPKDSCEPLMLCRCARRSDSLMYCVRFVKGCTVHIMKAAAGS